MRHGARCMGVDKAIGSIDVGEATALAPVKGNPATNIKDIENVTIVFKDGVGYHPAKLCRSGPCAGFGET